MARLVWRTESMSMTYLVEIRWPNTTHNSPHAPAEACLQSGCQHHTGFRIPFNGINRHHQAPCQLLQTLATGFGYTQLPILALRFD